MSKSKRVTQAEVDVSLEQMKSDMAALYAGWRQDEERKPEAVLAKIEQTEELLKPFMGKEVIPGWKLEGWSVQPKADAIGLWPIEATVHLRHRRVVGHEAAILWGETGSDAAMEWLEEIGFPLGEVELSFL